MPGGGGDKNVICVASVPKSLVFCSIVASLYDILHKDVEQDMLSQASMPLATFTACSNCS